MTVLQSRESTAAPKAQAAGSRSDVAATVIAMFLWFGLATVTAVVAALGTLTHRDPTIYLAVLFAGWMYLTPYVLPSNHRRGARKGGRR